MLSDVDPTRSEIDRHQRTTQERDGGTGGWWRPTRC